MRSLIFVASWLPLVTQAVTYVPSMERLAPVPNQTETQAGPNRSISLGPWGTMIVADIPIAVETKATAPKADSKPSVVAQLLAVHPQKLGEDAAAVASITLVGISSHSEQSALDVRKRR